MWNQKNFQTLNPRVIQLPHYFQEQGNWKSSLHWGEARDKAGLSTTTGTESVKRQREARASLIAFSAHERDVPKASEETSLFSINFCPVSDFQFHNCSVIWTHSVYEFFFTLCLYFSIKSHSHDSYGVIKYM